MRGVGCAQTHRPTFVADKFGVFAVLQDTIMRQTEYWRALLGLIILLLVMVFPAGIVGGIINLLRRRRTTS